MQTKTINGNAPDGGRPAGDGPAHGGPGDGGPDHPGSGADGRGGGRLRADSAPVLAGAAVAVGGVGAFLALADIASPLRAPCTLFFLVLAPATAVAAALGRLDPLSRTVVAGAGAVAVDLLVAQVMLALHIWSARGGVVAVAVLSGIVFLGVSVRRRRSGARGRGSRTN
ncbi:hypothetical protein [Streptomyces sp. CB02923]|uniref:hypothetical protein n=1 Tax=Streptomyces sp. CB02923 TaxID=1718985 RepID=UPI000A9B3B67|nr:hypothetical protein [Streptomyces sp. CB02923]